MQKLQAVLVMILDRSDVIYDRVDISKTEPMTDRQYYVRGCTALLDAVGGAIKHISNIHKYAREEDVPEKTIFVITTDGMENASRTYNYDKVRQMIERQKEEHDWEFVFLGANIDAAKEAARFGISASRVATYRQDSHGTRLNFDVMSEAISEFRCAEYGYGGAVFEDMDILAPIREYEDRYGDILMNRFEATDEYGDHTAGTGFYWYDSDPKICCLEISSDKWYDDGVEEEILSRVYRVSSDSSSVPFDAEEIWQEQQKEEAMNSLVEGAMRDAYESESDYTDRVLKP